MIDIGLTATIFFREFKVDGIVSLI